MLEGDLLMAKIEVERVVKRKFASRTSGKSAQRRFKKRASKMAIIVKIKDDGSKKHRLIVDLKRSGKNALAYMAERVVLPRLQDAVFMMPLMLRMLSNLNFSRSTALGEEAPTSA